jgi:hypothetical protein
MDQVQTLFFLLILSFSNWLRRFATTCLVYGAAFHLWTSLVYLQFDSEITQSSTEDHVAQKGGTAEEIDASYSEEENASFIPLSWPRLCDGELYAYTDPEWKAFAEIRKDVKGLHKIKSVSFFPPIKLAPKDTD